MTDRIGRAEYQLEADDTQLRRDLAEAGRLMQSTGKAMESAFGKQATTAIGQTDKAVQGLSGRIKAMASGGGIGGAILGGVGLGVGLGVFGAVTAGVRAVIDVIGDAAEQGSRLEEAQSKVNVVFSESSDTINEWAETSAQAMGISTQAALEAAGTFGNFIQALGNTEEEANGMSRELVQLASDLASFNNVNVDEVLIALRSGLAGEAEPMRRLGVSISATRVENSILAKGLVRTKAEITDAMKVTERYAIIMEDTALAQGDFERTSTGAANSQRRLAAVIETALGKLGQVLTPVIAQMAGFAADVVPQIMDALAGLGDAFNNLNRFINTDVALQQDFEEQAIKVAEGLGLTTAQVLAYREAQLDAAKATLAQSQAEEELRRHTTGLEADAAKLTERQQLLADQYVQNARLLNAQKVPMKEILDQVAEWTGVTREQLDAQARLTPTFDKLIPALMLTTNQTIAVTQAAEDHKSALDDLTAAQELAIGIGGAVVVTNALQEAAMLALTGKTEDYSEAIDLAGSVTDGVVRVLEQFTPVVEDVAFAMATTVPPAEDMTEQLELMSSKLGDVRSASRAAEKAWQDLADGPDINRKRMKELREEVDKWSRRYLKAIADGDDAQAALALANLNRSRAELSQREAGRKALGKEQDAVEELSAAVGKVPARKAITILLEGGMTVVTQLRTVEAIMAGIDRTLRISIRTALPGLFQQHGGPVEANRPYIVGERRAELFVPKTAGTIIPRVPDSYHRGGGSVEHRHTVTLEGARNLRSAGYDEGAVARLLVAASRSADIDYAGIR